MEEVNTICRITSNKLEHICSEFTVPKTKELFLNIYKKKIWPFFFDKPFTFDSLFKFDNNLSVFELISPIQF